MKHLSRRILTGLLTAVLVISLVGCATAQPKVEEVPTTPVATGPSAEELAQQAEAKKAEAEAKLAAEAQVKAEAMAKAEAEAEAEAMAQAKAEAMAQAKAEAMTKAMAQAKADAIAKAQAKAQALVQAKAKAEAMAKAEAEMKAAKAEAAAKAKVIAAAKAEAAARAKMAAAREAKKTAVYPYGVKTIVKSDKNVDNFDMYIGATGNINGALDGIDYAQYATLLSMAYGYTDNCLLIDAGNATSGSPAVDMFVGEPATMLLNALGYDVVVPGARDYVYGTDLLKSEATYAYQNTNLKYVSSNTLTKNGNPLLQPFQVYYFNGKTVLVAGLTSPMASKHDTECLDFTNPVIVKNAQDAVDYAKSVVDYVIVVGNTSDSAYSAETILNNVKGIDLYIDASEEPCTKVVNGTTLVGTGSNFQNVSVIDIAVRDGKICTTTPLSISKADIENPSHSALAQSIGLTTIERNASIADFLGQVNDAYNQVVADTAAAQKAKKAQHLKAFSDFYGVQPVVKSKGTSADFDLYIGATGNMYGATNGIDYAKLSTLLKAGRQLTPNTLLLDTGEETHQAQSMDGAVVANSQIYEMLGYDAVAPGEGCFSHGIDDVISITKHLMKDTSTKVISANVFTHSGMPFFQPFQLYQFNGKTVFVSSLTCPEAKSENDGGLSFDKRIAFDAAEAKQIADYVVIMTNDEGGVFDADSILKVTKDVDLIIEASEKPFTKVVGKTTILGTGSGMQHMGLVTVSFKDGSVSATTPTFISAQDINDPGTSSLAQSFGITSIARDAEVKDYLDTVQKAYIASQYPLGIGPVEKSVGDSKDFDLYIVHTNDVDGVLESDGTTKIGYAQFATLLQMGRSITDKILLLDAGNATRGTNVVNLFNGEPSGVLFDMLGYDAVAPGNHDFYYGTDAVKAAADFAKEKSSVKVLSANVLNQKGESLFQPYQIYDYNGFKVAVIGLTSPMPSLHTNYRMVKNTMFVNPLDTLKETQAFVNEAHEYADYVVVLGAFGDEGDLSSNAICQAINGIDLFVDGMGSDASKMNEMVNGTLIVRTGKMFENVGVVDVRVKNGKAVGAMDQIISAQDVINPSNSDLAQSVGLMEIPANHMVKGYVEKVNAMAADKLNMVVAKLPMKLIGEPSSVLVKNTNLSLWISKQVTKTSGADFTMLNAGSLKASLPMGMVTYGDVLKALPYGEHINVCEVSGADVLAALENGYAHLPEANEGFVLSDLKVVYNKYAQAGSRILFAMMNNKMIDKDSTYKVCVNDYLLNGGSGYSQFKHVVSTDGLVSDIILDALKAQYPAK